MVRRQRYRLPFNRIDGINGHKRKTITTRRSQSARSRLVMWRPRCSFVEFKSHDELVALWLAQGDESVATWIGSMITRPVLSKTDPIQPIDRVARIDLAVIS